ncbi:MAG: PilZ domain-containing protein [Sandaracinaceae bacterium]|nr:PilZ domain-containing protein [Sandaracinaceae bacterium]
MPEDAPHFRRTARQPIELGVRYRRDADGAPLEQAGRLVDLGLGGAQIKCERPPPLGAALRITLTAPSAWDPLDLPARVRWVGGRTFGVAFEPLSPPQAAALYELLRVSRFAREEGA